MEKTTARKKIAVFVNGWSTEYISMVLGGIRDAAAADGIDIFVYVSYILWGQNDAYTENRVNIFRAADPSDYIGAILLTNTFNVKAEQQTILSRFSASGVPMISSEIRLPGIPFIGTSNYKGMYELGRHLIEVHHVKNVVYVSGIEGNEECIIRGRALSDALKESGLEILDTLYGSFAFYNAYQTVGEWIDSGRPVPDAFVCANDQMALGTVSALHSRGIETPQDVIVTGFDQIAEGQTTYPMIATVSRQWNRMGTNLYRELISQISHPDPGYEHLYDSRFVPSESCGCKPKREALKTRLEKIRNVSYEITHNDMIEFMFQSIRGAMTKIENREQFYETACTSLRFQEYLGGTYCICTDPMFFDSTDDDYEPRHDGYPDTMEVLFERMKNEPVGQRTYPVSEVYPGYHPEGTGSDIYVIAPLIHMDYNIGYVGIKNRPEVLYDLRFLKWLNNMDTLLISIRQYMISQRFNSKLKSIYMTDFLTGMHNRTGCEDVLFRYIEEEKEAGRKAILLFTDIDCMKTVNDVYGHLSGDIAIKTTAEGIRRSLPEGWLTGRFGGDEFVAVGPYTDDFSIEEYRKRFNDCLAGLIEQQKISFPLSASVGFSVITPDRSGTIEAFIRSADESMYQEKEKAHKRFRAGTGR